MKLELIKTHRLKWITHTYMASWASLKAYPRFWLNKSISTPNFDHWSLVCRWGWWYFGIQRKIID